VRVAVLSLDVEQDCPPYLDTWRGVEEGLPKLLDLFEEEGVRVTLFVTGEVYRRYPGLLRRALDGGHELAVHGLRHERLDRLLPDEAARAVEKATALASKLLGEAPRSFRAPNLRMPHYLYPVLARLGYRYDSSTAVYKPPFTPRPRLVHGVLTIPVSATSSLLRLPWRLQEKIHRILPKTRVYFAHPWEYVDLRGVKSLRWDCRFNTGDTALELLRRLVRWFRSNHIRLATLEELGGMLEKELNV